MSSAFTQAIIFLVKTGASLFFILLLLRFLLQFFRINFYNPAAQWIFMATNPILIPLQKLIPKHSRIDFPCLAVLVLLKVLEYSIINLIAHGFIPHFSSLLILPVGEALTQTINFFFFAIIMVAIFSWLNPGKQNPLTEVLTEITEPLLAPARKLFPPAMSIDFSPILVLVLLKLADILFAHPIIQLGTRLVYGF